MGEKNAVDYTSPALQWGGARKSRNSFRSRGPNQNQTELNMFTFPKTVLPKVGQLPGNSGQFDNLIE